MARHSNRPAGLVAACGSGKGVGVRSGGVGGVNGVGEGNGDVAVGSGVGSHGQASAGGVGHGGLQVGVGVACGVGVTNGDCGALGDAVDDNGEDNSPMRWGLQDDTHSTIRVSKTRLWTKSKTRFILLPPRQPDRAAVNLGRIHHST